MIEYRGIDRGGNAEQTKTATFTIMNPTVVDGEVRAIVPSLLALSVASPAPIGPFIPGVAQTYTGTATATVTSGPTPQLQVYDPDTNNGRLVNGTSVIPRNLRGCRPAGPWRTSRTRPPPRTVATWMTPVASTTANVQFSQAIQAYRRPGLGRRETLRFVLTTTTQHVSQ